MSKNSHYRITWTTSKYALCLYDLRLFWRCRVWTEWCPSTWDCRSMCRRGSDPYRPGSTTGWRCHTGHTHGTLKTLRGLSEAAAIAEMLRFRAYTLQLRSILPCRSSDALIVIDCGRSACQTKTVNSRVGKIWNSAIRNNRYFATCKIWAFV